MQADGHISDSYIYGLNQLQIENTGKRCAYVHAQVFFFFFILALYSLNSIV